MLQFIISILAIFLTIFFVIGTHELAHFAMARWLNIKILRFSIGFGKRLWHHYDKHGTEYVLALIPLGGYVKMLDENEGEVPKEELHLAFNRQPFYKKFLVVLAGPLINILCALLLYWLIFVIGFVTIKPIIGNVTANSIAAQSGLKANQEIIRVDDRPTQTWSTILLRFIAHAGNQDQIKVEVKNLTDDKTATYFLNVAQWQMNDLTPDPLSSLGIKPYEPEVPLIIGTISPGSPAATANLQRGDKIIAINKNPIKTWIEFINMISPHPDQTLTFTLERQGKTLTLPVTIGHQRNLFLQKSGYLGIAPNFELPQTLQRKIQYNPLIAIPKAWEEIRDFTYFNLLIFGKIFTGKLSLHSLGGPITIFETAGAALNYGIIPFLAFLAFLSISIGIINLLPIPGLDGGHLVLQVVELISGKPVPEKVLLLLLRLGLIFILVILIQAIANDLLRMF